MGIERSEIMKKSIWIVIALLLIAGVALAGSIRTTPSNIVLTNPTTNQVDLRSITFNYSSKGDHSAVIRFNIIDSNNDVRAEEKVVIQDREDNPATDAALCTDVGNPFECCTGAGTGDCDETLTEFTDLIQGFASTLDSRVETIVWQYIQGKYTTQ